MKFVNPRNDVAFKKIFGNEQKKEILISFLNAVLGLTGEKEIQEIELLNPYQAPRLEAMKYTLLDVRVKDKRGVTFIVEMQVEKVAGLRKRFAYYAAHTYASQIERGEDYPKLNQVIFIGILDFVEFDSQHYLTRHQILNTETFRQDIEALEFNFIELPKFTKTEEELETILERWVYFLKHADKLEVIPPSADIPPLHEAYEVANAFGWSKEELELYDYWGIKAQDERGMIEYALEKGRQEGRQKGRQEGRKERDLEIARNMLAKGYTPVQISELTGLSEKEVTLLAREAKK